MKASSSCRKRQTDGEAANTRAAKLDPAIVEANDFRRDGEAESCARLALVETMAALAELAQPVRGKSRPIVLSGNDYHRAFAAAADRYLRTPPVRRVLEHHAEELDQVVGVEVDRQRGIDLHIPGQFLAGARALQNADRPVK